MHNFFLLNLYIMPIITPIMKSFCNLTPIRVKYNALRTPVFHTAIETAFACDSGSARRPRRNRLRISKIYNFQQKFLWIVHN